MAKAAEWACRTSTDERIASMSREYAKRFGVEHWSRAWEYPWVMRHADLRPDSVVLDAAGGNAVLQVILSERCTAVVNLDADPLALRRAWERYHPHPHFGRVRLVEGELADAPFPPEFFDRITCVSVLEHCPVPLQVLHCLWDMLRVGGRLLVTLDVADHARWNHTLTQEQLPALLGQFDLTVPPQPKNISTKTFNEIEPQPGEPDKVVLRVLCFYADKDPSGKDGP